MMRVTEQLMRDNLRKKQHNARNLDEEETLTYIQHKKQKPINTDEDIFHNSRLEGINTKESVFNRTAVFRTGGIQS